MSNYTQSISDCKWIIEATRKCPNACIHCLRGPAQNKSMSETVFRCFDRTIQASSVTISGGEPFYNLDLLLWVRYSGYISCVHITTSGKTPKGKTNEVFQELQMLSQTKELILEVSEDIYHQHLQIHRFTFKDNLENWGIKTECGKRNNFQYGRDPINAGYAHKNQLGFRFVELNLLVEKYFEDNIFMVTYDGDVYPGCDYSYAMLRKFKKHLCIGNVVTDSLDTIQGNFLKLTKGKQHKLLMNEEEFSLKPHC